MSKTKLALLGGTPVISAPLQGFHSIGEDEVTAASEVIRGGVLSAYIGAPGPGFMGGAKVKQFEAQAAAYFGVKHAIAVNSWTSGLIAAVGAIERCGCADKNVLCSSCIRHGCEVGI
jgi:dTDP-4-amino-4,6-dideoxygalactose transaminase